MGGTWRCSPAGGEEVGMAVDDKCRPGSICPATGHGNGVRTWIATPAFTSRSPRWWCVHHHSARAHTPIRPTRRDERCEGASVARGGGSAPTSAGTSCPRLTNTPTPTPNRPPRSGWSSAKTRTSSARRLGRFCPGPTRSRSFAPARTATPFLAAIDEERPDAVLTDIRMPPGGSDEGIRWRARCASTHPDIGVVVLSQFAEPTLRPVAAGVRLGATGVPAQGAPQQPRASSSPRSPRWRRAGR